MTEIKYGMFVRKKAKERDGDRPTKRKRGK
jgi:hypothetical protein